MNLKKHDVPNISRYSFSAIKNKYQVVVGVLQ